MRSLLLPAFLLALAVPAQAQGDAAKAPPAASDPNKMICKREVRIGTLAGGTKVCRTRAEWQSVRNDAQRDTRTIQGGAGGQTPQ